MTQLPFRSATEVAAAVRGKEISSTELVECYLDRIEALNPALGAVVTVAAERAFSEAGKAITNVVRHSGASRCSVDLRLGDAVDIEIRDNGRGFPAARGDGVGLASIRRRAESCGGTLAISTSAAGTCLTVRLPAEPAP